MNSSINSVSDADDLKTPSIVFSPRQIDDLLVFLSPNDKTFDNVSESSSISYVSHPFSEETHLNGKDITNQTTFSDVHKETMWEIRKEMEKAESVCSTCYSCSSCSTDTWEALSIDVNKINSIKPQQLPVELQKELRAKINAYSIKTEKYKKETKTEKEGNKLKKRDKKNTKKKHDPMSGLWNMLSTYDEFVVTPPGYNAFQQEKPHWMDQEEIPWIEKEKARKKCVKWLEKYHK